MKESSRLLHDLQRAAGGCEAAVVSSELVPEHPEFSQAVVPVIRRKADSSKSNE